MARTLLNDLDEQLSRRERGAGSERLVEEHSRWCEGGESVGFDHADAACGAFDKKVEARIAADPKGLGSFACVFLHAMQRG